MERLRAAGVPAGPVNSVGEAIDWAHAMGLEPTVADPANGYRAIRSPIRIDGDAPAECVTPPAIDQHGDEIRSRFAP